MELKVKFPGLWAKLHVIKSYYVDKNKYEYIPKLLPTDRLTK